MMKFNIFILFFYVGVAALIGQESTSKADNYFYMYAYEDAIAEYQKEIQKGALTNAQQLNLADSYFKTGNFKDAAKIYLDVNRNDTIMTSNRFNTMLQSLSKIGQNDSIKSLLTKNKKLLSSELMDNANFNYELLQSTNENADDFKVFNINGNSEQSDFSPTFFKDQLLFTSGRGHKAKRIYGPSGEAYLDIYLAKIGPDGDIVNPNLFDKIPESKYHKATPFYAESLNRVFYSLSNTENDELLYDENGKNSLAMAMSRNTSSGDNSFNYLLKDLGTSFYFPFYQESTGKLFFAANFDDGYGGTDIYFVYTNNAQIMSEPINAGPRVNSPGNEIAPFILNNDLYFASDVFYGLGGMDIYKTHIQSDDTFSIPINLGNTINSPYDDFGFILKGQNANGYLGYFSSNRPNGKGKDDIYGFKVNQPPGLKTLVLRGIVAKPITEVPIDQALLQVLDKQGNILKEVTTIENGSYQIEIPWRDEVVLVVSKDKYSKFNKFYDKSDLEAISGNAQQIE
ncbi:MAG: OmpA family protein, partial [Flavobacteriaceae bacterium]